MNFPAKLKIRFGVNPFALLIACIHVFNISFAQPDNDTCYKASAITITNSGFGLGTFTSAIYDISQASVQTGETFAPAILVAGLNKKSMWYKFTLPTTRTVRVILAQPGTAITAGDAGFAVYKANNCLPVNADISTKLTPIGTFGNTFHPCAEAGDYLVQVTGNDNANGPLYLQLQLSDSTNSAYDHPPQAYNFGTLSQGIKSVDYSVDCQSMEGPSEICPVLYNSSSYNKTTWHVFKTPAYFDYLAILLASPNGSFSNGVNNTIGYTLYRGDARTTPVTALAPVAGCDSFFTAGYYPATRLYRCSDLQPDSTYSIQLFFRGDFNENIRLAISLNGIAPTQAPEPILSAIPPSNNLGILPSSPSGQTTTATDYFGCNSRHSIHPCQPSLPANGINHYIPYYNYTHNYNLSTFYTFTLSTTSNVDISTSANCWSTYVRLYKQGLSNNCSTLDTSNIVSQFEYNNYNIKCLDPGTYTLQVSGSDTTLLNYSWGYYNSLYNTPNPLCILGNLGQSINVNITVRTIHTINEFSLSSAGAFDSLNVASGIMQPLINGNAYYSKPDTFGCSNTVLPWDTTCTPTNKKAIYRQFLVADSGIVSLSFLPYYWFYYYNFSNKLYKGDANALAISQNVHSFPQRISGLDPYTLCLQNNPVYNPAKACIIPGTYSYVTFGDEANIGQFNQSLTEFHITNTVHNSPDNAEDLGDILNIIPPNSGSLASSIDHFSCKDNVIPINGYVPCLIAGQPATKAIYRQFYLNSSGSISISGPNSMTLFAGKATDGIATLIPMPAPWQCFNNASSLNNCLPAGWYTIISYGGGPTFENPLQNYEANNYLGKVDQITISACPGPKHNRPYKAAIDTITNQPFLIQWGPRVGSTPAYPVTDTAYTLYTEYYNCTVDTPFSSHPIVNCDPAMTKVTYYVFKTTQESYVQINTYDHWGAVYSGDVRYDSASFAAATPVQPCEQRSGNIQICRLQPGTYTLVIFASGSSNSCTSITPTIYIDKTGYSRFDHANNAYDFGTIPPDSLYHNGKAGDVNPLDPGRSPSNDFFYCTTGSQPNDPTDAVCGQEYNANIYSGNMNNYMYPAPGANGGYFIPRRNLWYSFVLNQGGNVRVKVSNKTPGKSYQYKFAVYKSDVNGSLPFSTVVNTGQVDSTINQGLSFIVQNLSYYYCYNAPDEVSFYRDPCSATTPERYYILVENSNSWPQNPPGIYPNSQAEVSILLDSVNSIQPLFDHYSQASNMGNSLGVGTYIGQTDNFSCATLDPTDPLSGVNTGLCNKTLWYKFSVSVTGHVRYRVNINNSLNYDVNKVQLFRQIIPGDSTTTGLEFFPNNYAYDNTTGNWAQNCISPGTYYLILPGCSRINEYAFPQIQIIEEAGDFCSNPVLAPLNGAGTSVSSVIIDCHTIGSDYGEFNPTLTCPNGATTSNYKTSWFKIDITGTDTLDVTTYLTENTNAQPSDIKYRLMNGDCSAMQERSCVQDAQTQDTYKCLPPGSYWVQVFSPVSKNGSPVTGTIDLHLSAVQHADSCAPINPCFANANFIPGFDCNTGDFVTFVNYSTYGSSIAYTWDFGYNGQTSSAVSPQFNYPALPNSQTYTITLTVQNNSCGGQGMVNGTITIPPRPAVNLGPDISLCHGGNVLLDASSYPGATYLWQDGSANPTYTVTTPGLYSYYVDVNYNGCTKRDTINVNISPLMPVTENKYLCSSSPIQLNSSRGYGETHHWNTGAATSSINVIAPGVYWDDVSLNGCTARDSFTVLNAAYPLGNDREVCFGSQSIALNATTLGAGGYIWEDGTTGAIFNATAAGLYWVDISFGSCSLRDTIVLSNLQPVAGNTSDTICQGQSYTLPSGNIINTAGVYSDTIRSAGGCDSLINTVNLAVQVYTSVNINAAICSGQTYTLPWGTIVNAAGEYKDTLHYATGCDSIRRTVNLAVQTATSQTVNPVICEGSNYTLPWGAVVSTAGIYRDTLHYTTGCDSIWRTINLTVQPLTFTTLDPVICEGTTYTLPWGAVVTTAGVYRDTLHYATGCDSIRQTVNLRVQSPATQVFNPVICMGSVYTLPWGTVVNTAGVYHDTLHFTTGCDSVWRTASLSVQSPSSQIFNPVICQGQTYTLPWGTVVNTAGIYHDTLHFTTGCDSVWRTVSLAVQSPSSQTFNPVICEGAGFTLPWGTVVNTAGMYSDTLHYTTGCDSVWRTVSLAVQSPISQISNPVICAGQTYTLPWGAVINSSGAYRDTLRYTTGCDSVWRTVNLSVQSPLSQTFNPIICEGSTYTLPWGIVVNTGGVYRDTLHYITGCDSIRRTVNLTVQTPASVTIYPIICAGQTYTLPWGAVADTTGVYTDTLHYTTGCDSVRRTVNLTVQSPSSQIFNPVICQGQPYTLPWGTVVNAGGVYRDTLYYTTGCDSIRRIVSLTVQIPAAITINPVICAGQDYTLPWGAVVNTAGVYLDTLHYTTGCDSIRRTVNLTVQTSTLVTTHAIICAGQTYTLPGGAVVNTAGIYIDTLYYTTTGCDSLRRTVNLTVQSPASVTTDPVICAGQTYTLPWGTVANTAGIYRDTLHYATGCDSVWRIVTLTVQSPLSQTFNPVICEGMTYTLPWSTVVNTAGVYRDTLHYTTGCDSVWRTVNLTVQSPASVTTSQIICAGQTYTLPWGTAVNTAGVYRDTLHYAFTGCDSLRRMVNLMVQIPASVTTNPVICAGQTYTLPWGIVVNTAGVYRDTLHYAITGCDSLRRIVNLTFQAPISITTNPVICAGQTYTLPGGTVVNTAGVYRDTLHYAITGCDSLRRTVNLTIQTLTSVTSNSIICAGQTYTLPWGTVVNITDIYRDTLHYTTGCDSIRRIVNLIVQSSASVTINPTICQGATYTLPWGTVVSTAGIYRDTLLYTTGCDSVRRTVNLQVKAAAVYTISPSICSDETYTLPWGILVNSAGIYKDTVRTAGGCDSLIRMINLTVDPAPSVTLSKSNDVNCFIGVSQLSASGGSQYQWSPAGTLSNPAISRPVASPGATTTYRVKVTSANGCIAEDSIKVIVYTDGADDGLLLPNAFTPNRDGKNDCFGVQTWGQVSDLRLYIYNRWGEIVFFTTDPSKCWDGTFKGTEQPSAVFIYQVSAKTNCGYVYRKGTVVLIR